MIAFWNSLHGRVFLLSLGATLVVVIMISWILDTAYQHSVQQMQREFFIDYAHEALQDLAYHPDFSQLSELTTGLSNPEVFDAAYAALSSHGLWDEELIVSDDFWDIQVWLGSSQQLATLPTAQQQQDLHKQLQTAFPHLLVEIKDAQGLQLPLLQNWQQLEPELRLQTPFIIVFQLTDGRTLNLLPLMNEIGGSLFGDQDVLLLIASLLVCMSLINLWMSSRVTQPLRQLQQAAQRFGQKLDTPALPETGITEVAQASRAFNRMQQQISELVQGRTQMLAAISHDLRTPITRLRLRAAMLADDKVQQNINADLDEITQMIDSSLEFLRNDAWLETPQTTDFSSLVTAYCQERQQLGDALHWHVSPHCHYDLRPVAIKRALSNLVDNALHYAQHVTVSLQCEQDNIILKVSDDGEGIPEALLSEVTKPFVRVDASRNQHTGGTGLGLASVLSIAQLHGGKLQLQNTHPGLAASIILPRY